MQYLGGKSRLANDVAALINALPRRKKSDCAGDSGNPVNLRGGGRLLAKKTGFMEIFSNFSEM